MSFHLCLWRPLLLLPRGCQKYVLLGTLSGAMRTTCPNQESLFRLSNVLRFDEFFTVPGREVHILGTHTLEDRSPTDSNFDLDSCRINHWSDLRVWVGFACPRRVPKIRWFVRWEHFICNWWWNVIRAFVFLSLETYMFIYYFISPIQHKYKPSPHTLHTLYVNITCIYLSRTPHEVFL